MEATIKCVLKNYIYFIQMFGVGKVFERSLFYAHQSPRQIKNTVNKTTSQQSLCVCRFKTNCAIKPVI